MNDFTSEETLGIQAMKARIQSLEYERAELHEMLNYALSWNWLDEDIKEECELHDELHAKANEVLV